METTVRLTQVTCCTLESVNSWIIGAGSELDARPRNWCSSLCSGRGRRKGQQLAIAVAGPSSVIDDHEVARPPSIEQSYLERQWCLSMRRDYYSSMDKKAHESAGTAARVSSSLALQRQFQEKRLRDVQQEALAPEEQNLMMREHVVGSEQGAAAVATTFGSSSFSSSPALLTKLSPASTATKHAGPFSSCLPTAASASQRVVSKGMSLDMSAARRRRLESRRRQAWKDTSKARIVEETRVVPSPHEGSWRAPPGGGDGVRDALASLMKEMGRVRLLTASEEVELSKAMKAAGRLEEAKTALEASVGHAVTADVWARHVCMPVPDLLRVLEEGRMAKDRMVMANLRLVVSLAKNLCSHGLDLPDLIQEGACGLIRGVEKFDHTRGYKLSTYVHWWIRQSLTRALADKASVVRLPVHVHDSLSLIKRTKFRLQTEGKPTSTKAISCALKMSERKVRTYLQVNRRVRSLDARVKSSPSNNNKGSDSPPLHHYFEDRNEAHQPWSVVEKKLLKEEIERLLREELNEREIQVLKMHHGLDLPGGGHMTLEAIGKRYNVSRERVRQVESAALRKLRLPSHSLELNSVSFFEEFAPQTCT